MIIAAEVTAIGRSPALHCLGQRQLEVAWSVALGHSDATIAIELGMAPATVRNHLTQIYQRLALESGNRRVRLARLVWIAVESFPHINKPTISR